MPEMQNGSHLETTPTKAANDPCRPRKKGAASWILKRDGDDGKQETCTLYVASSKMQVREFPFESAPPTVRGIAELWGSGTYRIQWKAKDGSPLGSGQSFTIDDPGHPRRPAYPNPPPPPEAPKPAEPAPAQGSLSPDVAAILAQLMQNPQGGIPLPLLIPLLMKGWEWMQTESERRERQRQQEFEHRMRKLELDAQKEIALAEQRARVQLAQGEKFLEALAKTSSNSQLTELAQKLGDLEEELEGREQGPWAQIGAAVVPHVGSVVKALPGVLQGLAKLAESGTPKLG